MTFKLGKGLKSVVETLTIKGRNVFVHIYLKCLQKDSKMGYVKPLHMKSYVKPLFMKSYVEPLLMEI